MLTWDHSHDYVLLRFRHDLTRITIRFQNSPASIMELIALRRCLPRFRDMAPAAVREMIGQSLELSIGSLPTSEAVQLIEAAKREGLEVFAESESITSYLPYNRTTCCAWLIEDSVEAAAVKKAMLAAGVPVQDSLDLDLSQNVFKASSE